MIITSEWFTYIFIIIKFDDKKVESLSVCSCFIEMLCCDRLHFLQQNHTKNGCSAHKQRWSPIPPIQSMCTDMYTTQFIYYIAAAAAAITAKTYQNAIASHNWMCVPLECFISNIQCIRAQHILGQMNCTFDPDETHLISFPFYFHSVFFEWKWKNQYATRIHMEKIQIMRHSNLCKPTSV